MMRNNKSDPKQCDDTCDGKLVVITGATSGIGYRPQENMPLWAPTLSVSIEIPINPKPSRRRSSDDFGVSCEYIIADLSELDEIKRVAKELDQLKPRSMSYPKCRHLSYEERNDGRWA